MIQDIILIPFLFVFSYLFLLSKRGLHLHPDTAQFLYIPVLKRSGYKFIPNKPLGSFCKNLFSSPTPASLNMLRGDYQPVQYGMPVVWFYNVFFRFYKGDIKGFRTLNAFYLAFTTCAIYLVAKKICPAPYPLVTSLFLLFGFLVPYTDSRQLHKEHYGLIFVLLSFLLILYDIKIGGLIAGILLVLAVLLFKITFLFDLVAIALYYPISGNIGKLPFFFLGIFFGLTLLFFICSTNGTLPFLASSLNPKIIFSWYKQNMPSEHMETGKARANSDALGLRNYLPFLLYISLPCYFTVIYIIKSFFIQPGMNTFFLFWLFLSLISIRVQNKYFPGHLIAMFIPVSFIAGFSFLDIYQGTLTSHVILNRVSQIGLVLFSLPSMFMLLRGLMMKTPDFHLSLYNSPPNRRALRFLAAEIMANDLRYLTHEEDRIFQWGNNVEVYPLAERRGTLGAIEIAWYTTDPELMDTLFGDVWREVALDSVKKWKPKYIADLHGSLNIEALNKYTGLKYEVEKIYYDLFSLYRLVEESPTDVETIEFSSLTSTNITRKWIDKEIPLNQFIDKLTLAFLRGDDVGEAWTNKIEQMKRDWEVVAVNL
ncbi:MAG: hypothetical protein AB1487_06150 [Thermodesulfobacteriota bacterium]